MSFAKSETLCFHHVLIFNQNFVRPFDGISVIVSVTIRQRILRFVKSFDENIGRIRARVRMTPAERFVVPGPDIRRAEHRKTGDIYSLTAVQMRFVTLPAAEKTDVRIEKEQRVSRSAFFRADRPHIRAFILD